MGQILLPHLGVNWDGNDFREDQSTRHGNPFRLIGSQEDGVRAWEQSGFAESLG